MLDGLFKFLSDLFTGKLADKEAEDYVARHKPKTREDVENLTAQYWQQKTKEFY